MASRNKTELIGYLGADPETFYFANGEMTATVSIATTETWKDKATGEKKEHTEWYRVCFYKGLADIVAKHLKKGAQVFVEGKLRTRKWQDKEGNDRFTTEIYGLEMQMLDKKPEGGKAALPPRQAERFAPMSEDDQPPY